jgi:hypothetical protein
LLELRQTLLLGLAAVRVELRKYLTQQDWFLPAQIQTVRQIQILALVAMALDQEDHHQ